MRRSFSTVRLTAAALPLALAVAFSGPAARASTKTSVPPLMHMKVDTSNLANLRTGALYVLHRCAACHSIQGTRFSSIAKQLGITNSEMQKYLNESGRLVHDTVVTAMPKGIMKQFVSITPPDLTVMAEAQSPDWLYTYLKSFYLDPTRPTGVNNVLFHNVAMPDVLANLQGLQSPVIKEGWLYGQPAKVAMGVKQLTKGTMTPAQFDQTAQDIVDFLYVVAHPHAKERAALGPWIMGLFGLLTIFSFLLYKVYWRRVDTSHERWWNHR